MTHLSLFSGIGGLDLAAEWAGFTTVGQCEWADYPTKVLEKHWPDVPRWRDIRTLTAEDFYARTGLRTVDLISGGFPCQPYSVAGNQKGKEDIRHLWPEMSRVIGELKPRWVVGENVPGILRIEADEICADLERQGYDVGIFDYEAAAVGALHRRERVFFVAHATSDTSDTRWAKSERQQRQTGIANGGKYDVPHAHNTGNGALQCGVDAHGQTACGKREQPFSEFSRHGKDVADAHDTTTTRQRKYGWEVYTEPKPIRLSGGGSLLSNAYDRSRIVWRNGQLSAIAEAERTGANYRGRTPQYVAGQWWAIEPDVGRVAHGVPARVDRLKCLGNAVVWQQAYPIFRAISEVMNG